VWRKAGIPRRRHQHGHPRDDHREDFGEDVGVGVVECQLNRIQPPVLDKMFYLDSSKFINQRSRHFGHGAVPVRRLCFI